MSESGESVKTIKVQVREDHLEILSRTKPMTALAELVWNSLDADATEVRIEFDTNDMDGIDCIRIRDNGHGLNYDDALVVFQNLGGSWKRAGVRSPSRRRMLHGQYGKGRFRAFSLGQKVAWHTVYAKEGAHYAFTVTGRAETPGEFTITNPVPAEGATTGMVVEIHNVPRSADLLLGVKALEEITEIFALYLRQYPDVRIWHDGALMDPAHVERHITEYDLDEMVMQNGERVRAALTVVEWNTPGKRGVFLCDNEGFMRGHALPRLYFRGFSYTAYLKSDHIATLDREGLLQAEELAPDVRQMLDAVRRKLREHFTLREVEKAQDVLEEWKELGIYPYAGAPKNDVEATERRIFDIYATHLNQIFSDFAAASLPVKRLTLRMIQELVARILDEILEFPEEKAGEVMELIRA
mgnify:FL=1